LHKEARRITRTELVLDGGHYFGALRRTIQTRSGVLEDRRVTRSMATPKPTLSGVVKRMVTAAPKAARKTAQKPKKTVLRKQNVTNPEPTSEDRATIGTDREMNTTTINNDTEIRAVTRSMTKKGDQTITVKSSVSKKTSVNATRGKGASTKNRGKATTSHEGSAPHAARPTTRSMTNNGESNVTIAPPEPPTQAERTLTASSHRITRQMANQNAPTTSSITNSAPNHRTSSRLLCKRQDYDHSSRPYRQIPKPVPPSDVRLRRDDQIVRLDEIRTRQDS
ncbi:hypothetical protein KCU60_g5, partial [Aureobasidium melanogenum]